MWNVYFGCFSILFISYFLFITGFAHHFHLSHCGTGRMAVHNGSTAHDQQNIVHNDSCEMRYKLILFVPIDPVHTIVPHILN